MTFIAKKIKKCIGIFIYKLFISSSLQMIFPFGVIFLFVRRVASKLANSKGPPRGIIPIILFMFFFIQYHHAWIICWHRGDELEQFVPYFLFCSKLISFPAF